jgi:ribonucleoside-diphosphate reductase alpha chain
MSTVVTAEHHQTTYNKNRIQPMKHDQVDTTEPTEPDTTSSAQLAVKQPRPDVLTGVTQRIQTGYGKLYITINEDADGRPFELFANIGSSGGFTASFTEALAKTVSTGLRSGVDPEEIASELRGIRSPKVGWDKGDKTQSIPDAIGLAMTRYLQGDPDLDYPQQQNLAEAVGEDATAAHKADGGTITDQEASPTTDTNDNDGDGGDNKQEDATAALLEAGESPECPECGSMSLYYSEGCKTCRACGWSEC